MNDSNLFESHDPCFRGFDMEANIYFDLEGSYIQQLVQAFIFNEHTGLITDFSCSHSLQILEYRSSAQSAFSTRRPISWRHHIWPV